MKRLYFSILLSFLSISSWAQMNGHSVPEFDLTKMEVEAHLRFLASDALQGRRTGEPGNVIAAAYLKSQLQAYGVQPIPGQADYFQPVALRQSIPPQSGTLTWKDKTFQHGDNMLVLAGNGINTTATAVFVNYGWVDDEKGTDDYKDIDVKGKIVLSIMGTADNQTPQGIFRTMRKKREIAAQKGAIALVELYRLPPTFWNNVKGYFGNPRLELVEGDDNDPGIPYVWLNEGDSQLSKTIQDAKSAGGKLELNAGASAYASVESSNVAGWIEGSDPKLKDEYVLLSAHYDHVGVGKQGGSYTAEDSIFNGARDNAFGTTALLAAAKSLSEKKPKRSVIILAVTGEEVGLLGSSYYAEHPLIPLEKTIVNLNTDGAGYNSTDIITIIGLGRTGIDEQLKEAAGKFNLKIQADPAPEQGLFDRSDNVSFAAKGIPAPTFSPGFTAFDEEIMKYYHQATDNPETIDYDYLLRFCKAFAYSARLIADMDKRPFWTAGDKYEAAGKKLYGLD